MEQADLLPTPSHITGPTWQRNRDGGWFLPAKNRTLGDQVVNWIYDNVTQPSGVRAGEPFLPTPEQFRFLLWWYALDDNGRFVYRSGVLRRMKGWGKDPLAAAMSLAELCGPVAFKQWDDNGVPVATVRSAAWIQVAAVSLEQSKNTFSLFPSMISTKLKEEHRLEVNKTVIYSEAGGRLEGVTSAPSSMEGNRPTLVIENEALAVDTPVPTPFGWVNMGDLVEGDTVFGSDGSQVLVSKVLPVQYGRDCYRVTFSDGTHLVASDGHLWYTKIVGSDAKTEIRTTRQMFDDGRRFSVPVHGMRQTPKVDLPVDPYLLGAWLGDGSTGDCNIMAGAEDVEELERQLSDRGVQTHRLKSLRDTVFRLSFTGTGGFQRDNRPEVAKRMSALPCYKDKHIPEQYMHAGTDQRVDLLRGLMDTDGCAANDGLCIFVGRNRLCSDVMELLRGLGQVPCLTFAPDNRSREGGTYRVTFTVRGALQPFAFKRKADKITRWSNRKWVSITAIEKVPSVPVRCIAVDADDHLFQAGVGGHVTHNTQEWVEANDGHNMHLVIEGNIKKSPGGIARSLMICNSHVPGRESVAEAAWEAWQAVQAGSAVDVGMLYDSIEAPAYTPVSEIPSQREDPEGFAAGIEKLKSGLLVCRGDSTWLDIPTLVESILDVRNPVSESRRKFLNQVNATEDSWVSPQEWDLCHDPKLRPLEQGDRIALGFDGSKSNDHTALVACRIDDGALFVIRTWNPDKHGGQVPREDVDTWVDICFSRYKPVAFRADVKEFESYIDAWGRKYKKKLIVNASPGNPVAFDMRGNQKRFALDCEKLYDAIVEQEVVHDGDRLLRQHVLNAHRHPTNYDAISIRKASKDSSRKIDAAVCAVLAFGARQEVTMSKKNRTSKGLVLSAR